MDDDSATMARIRQEIPHHIEKWSDLNHTKKGLGKSLYALQPKHKAMHNVVVGVKNTDINSVQTYNVRYFWLFKMYVTICDKKGHESYINELLTPTFLFIQQHNGFLPLTILADSHFLGF